MAEVLPMLYLHGLSSIDFMAAMAQFLGSGGPLVTDDQIGDDAVTEGVTLVLPWVAGRHRLRIYVGLTRPS